MLPCCRQIFPAYSRMPWMANRTQIAEFVEQECLAKLPIFFVRERFCCFQKQNGFTAQTPGQTRLLYHWPSPYHKATIDACQEKLPSTPADLQNSPGDKNI